MQQIDHFACWSEEFHILEVGTLPLRPGKLGRLALGRISLAAETPAVACLIDDSPAALSAHKRCASKIMDPRSSQA